MTERQEQIAELYFRSNSVKTEGLHELSIHRDNPSLPLSPWYMHFPEIGQPGAELLPEMFELIGEEFYELCESQKVPFRPQKITGHPNGATYLGRSWAEKYVGFPGNFIEFEKIKSKNSQSYSLVEGVFEPGDELGIAEDHVSGARNNGLFVAHAREVGFSVSRLLAVVDRQQGAKENLEAIGVDLLAIFTATAILEYGLAERHIKKSKFDEIQDYRAANQF